MKWWFAYLWIALVACATTATAPAHTPVSSHPPTPSVDAAVAAYRMSLDRDWSALKDAQLSFDGVSCGDAGHAAQCRPKLQNLRMAAQRVRIDLASATAPAGLKETDSQFQQGLDELVSALATRETALDSGDYVTADQAGVNSIRALFTPEGRLNELVADIDCYPRHVDFSDTMDRWICVNS